MKYDAAFREVMGRDLENTEGLKILDLYLLGEAVLNSIGACVQLGHANPANTVLDYTPQPTDADHVSKHILRDLLAWQSGRRDKSPDCEERLRSWVTTDWLPRQAASMSAHIWPEDVA